MRTDDWELVEPYLKSRVVTHLGTVAPDGSPHVSPMWVDVADRMILVNTTEGTEKLRNMRRDPRVALSIHASDDPFLAFTIFGTVVGETSEGADGHIDELSIRYDGVPWPEHGIPRVVLRIRPDRVVLHGGISSRRR